MALGHDRRPCFRLIVVYVRLATGNYVAVVPGAVREGQRIVVWTGTEKPPPGDLTIK
jgi:hypothetical protein